MVDKPKKCFKITLLILLDLCTQCENNPKWHSLYLVYLGNFYQVFKEQKNSVRPLFLFVESKSFEIKFVKLFNGTYCH